MTGRIHLPNVNNRGAGMTDWVEARGERPRNCGMKMTIKGRRESSQRPSGPE